MKVGKAFAALVVCLAVLWASRFAPYTCEGLRNMHVDNGSSWPAIAGGGLLLTVFLYLIVYDIVAFLTYRLGWEQSFDHLELYPADADNSAPPISLTTKLFLLYPLDLALVAFFLLPFWTKCAYCS
jgi:hypothetical protein